MAYVAGIALGAVLTNSCWLVYWAISLKYALAAKEALEAAHARELAYEQWIEKYVNMPCTINTMQSYSVSNGKLIPR